MVSVVPREASIGRRAARAHRDICRKPPRLEQHQRSSPPGIDRMSNVVDSRVRNEQRGILKHFSSSPLGKLSTEDGKPNVDVLKNKCDLFWGSEQSRR
ncbi:uncharacterized protein LOC131012096 isoform X2 [Salvia miltiorrhiza]|uniref:uncharacterized protein LOC131012096 isoform X2 n=1 Tax=Salvia miltiorrhiza TaxID=226208 RepID=UPI0025ACF4E7|nr:uncharacterized protein LOC131012096 isoform X2 [Salvia miltiorrhiza]